MKGLERRKRGIGGDPCSNAGGGKTGKGPENDLEKQHSHGLRKNPKRKDWNGRRSASTKEREDAREGEERKART